MIEFCSQDEPAHRIVGANLLASLLETVAAKLQGDHPKLLEMVATMLSDEVPETRITTVH